METKCEAVAAVSADAAIARGAAVALNEQAVAEMETACEAVVAVSADAAIAREAAVALNEQATVADDEITRQ